MLHILHSNNTINNIPGYLCKKVIQRFDDCVTCVNAIRKSNDRSSSISKLVDEKSRGRLIHANMHFFKLINFVESAFSKHANCKYVFDLTVDEVIKNYNFTFPCLKHASDILSYSIYYYIRLRMRQFSHQENKKKQKQFAIKNKLAKLTKQ